jgi:hypothetical protein
MQHQDAVRAATDMRVAMRALSQSALRRADALCEIGSG